MEVSWFSHSYFPLLVMICIEYKILINPPTVNEMKKSLEPTGGGQYGPVVE